MSILFVLVATYECINGSGGHVWVYYWFWWARMSVLLVLVGTYECIVGFGGHVCVY